MFYPIRSQAIIPPNGYLFRPNDIRKQTDVLFHFSGRQNTYYINPRESRFWEDPRFVAAGASCSIEDSSSTAFDLLHDDIRERERRVGEKEKRFGRGDILSPGGLGLRILSARPIRLRCTTRQIAPPHNSRLGYSADRAEPVLLGLGGFGYILFRNWIIFGGRS